MSVALRSLGPWLSIKAMALSMYARTVIWMVSFERRTPCMLRSGIVQWHTDKTDCHRIYLKPLRIFLWQNIWVGCWCCEKSKWLLTNWRVNLGDKSKSAWSLMKAMYSVAKKDRIKLHTVAVFLTINFRSTGLSYLLQHFNLRLPLSDPEMHIRNFFKIKVRIVDLQLSPISRTFTL